MVEGLGFQHPKPINLWRNVPSLAVGSIVIRTLRGVGGLNTHNKDLIRPIYGSIVPYPPKGPYEIGFV